MKTLNVTIIMRKISSAHKDVNYLWIIVAVITCNVV